MEVAYHYIDKDIKIIGVTGSNGKTTTTTLIYEVLKKAGISVKFLYNIESGKQGFSSETLFNLAQALHVKCDYILKGSKESMYDNSLTEVIDMFDESQTITLIKILKAIYEMGIY